MPSSSSRKSHRSNSRSSSKSNRSNSRPSSKSESSGSHSSNSHPSKSESSGSIIHTESPVSSSSHRQTERVQTPKKRFTLKNMRNIIGKKVEYIGKKPKQVLNENFGYYMKIPNLDETIELLKNEKPIREDFHKMVGFMIYYLDRSLEYYPYDSFIRLENKTDNDYNIVLKKVNEFYNVIKKGDSKKNEKIATDYLIRIKASSKLHGDEIIQKNNNVINEKLTQYINKNKKELQTEVSEERKKDLLNLYEIIREDKIFVKMLEICNILQRKARPNPK